jgi:DNA-binding FrmR family transcriptional regulator
MEKKNKKSKTLINFKKAHSLISKIIEMVEKDCYCINVMQQNLAVIGLLRSAHEMLMENHLNTCFKNAMASKNERKKKQMAEEILKVTNLYNK